MAVGISAAAAKSLQASPTLCDPIDGSPPGTTVPGILQARTLEWVVVKQYNYLLYIDLISCNLAELYYFYYFLVYSLGLLIYKITSSAWYYFFPSNLDVFYFFFLSVSA